MSSKLCYQFEAKLSPLSASFPLVRSLPADLPLLNTQALELLVDETLCLNPLAGKYPSPCDHLDANISCFNLSLLLN